jgi:putative sporulation protein YtaF
MSVLTVFSSLLFAISANIDSIVVGLSLGIKNIRVGPGVNLIIACILSAVTVLSIAAGELFFIFISKEICDALGGGLLILIGLYSLWKAVCDGKRHKKKRPGHMSGYFEVLDEPGKADADRSGNIDAKESIILAAVLSLNNMGMGISAGITGINIYVTAAFSFVLSILFLSAGYRLGKRFSFKVFGKYASILAALLIILLGVYEMLF